MMCKCVTRCETEIVEPSDGFAGFVAAYEEGSVSGGARRMGIPRATLSRQLSRLEARLGVRLVHRDTRRFDPTEAGLELYERARRIVDESRAAVDALRRADGVPRGKLRLSMPPTPGGDNFGFDRMLIAFARIWPEVDLEVHTGSQHIDLRAARFDVALRAGIQRDPDLVARTLLDLPVHVVGAPRYLAAHGHPKRSEDLASHRLLVGFAGGVRPGRSWPLVHGGTLKVHAAFSSNDLLILRSAARDGLGLALLPELPIRRDLLDGALVPVLEDVVGTRNTLAVVYPSRAYLQPKVRAFVDHATAWVRSATVSG